MTDPKRIDPPDCGCTDCLTGYSRPLNQWGDDEQFGALLHGQAENATSVELADLHLLLNLSGRESFGQFLCAELRAGRLVSRPRIESKAVSRVLGDLFD
jgi:hypothetical protein